MIERKALSNKAFIMIIIAIILIALGIVYYLTSVSSINGKSAPVVIE